MTETTVAPDSLESSDVLTTLCEIVAEVLGYDAVEPSDNVFALGMSSLSGVQIVARIADRLGVELDLLATATAPTVAELAAVVLAARQAGTAAGEAIVRETDDAPPVMPLLQHDVWVWSQFPPYVYSHVVRSARVRGPLDLDALDRALQVVLRRHEPLRTVFRHDAGYPYPVVQDLPDEVAMLWEPPKGRVGAELTSKLIKEVVETPFDLVNGPLFRFAIIRESRSSHIVIVCVHEIVTDGWGMDVLVRDLDAAYRYEIGTAAEPLGELPVRYRDVASWERRVLTGEVYGERLAFWQRTLAGAPFTLPMPMIRDSEAPLRRAQRSVTLDAATSAKVRELCADRASTPFTFFLTIYALLLRRHTGRSDLLVESPVANRNRSAMEPIVGFFALGRLPFRLDVSEAETFAGLLDRVGDTARDAIRNAGVPVSVIRMERMADLPRGLADDVRPRFRFRVPDAQIRLDQLRSESEQLAADEERFAFWVEDLGQGGYRVSLVFDENRLGRDDARKLLNEAAQMTAAAVVDPTLPAPRIGWVPETSTRPLAGPAVPLPGGTLLDAVAGVAAATPDAVAVDDPDGAMTYGALDAEATRLAGLLAGAGIGAGALVTVDVPPSAGCVAAILGTFRAGATCSLDPALSSHATISRAADGALAVQGQGGGDAVPYAAFAVGVDRDVPVVVGHEALLNVAQWQATKYGLGATDRVAVEAGPGGAAWALSPWAALSAGATVVVPPSSAAFPAWLAASDATVAVVHRDPGPLPESLRLLFTDGAVPDGLPRGVDVVRVLRVAEAGGVAAFATGADPFRPIPNVTLTVVDDAGLPVPPSTIGSLVVAAPGVAERQVGWLASAGEWGVTAHCPRWADLDLHGFRLAEPAGPVEAMLAEHPGIDDAALGTATGEWGDVLTAYVVPRGDAELDAEDVDRWLKERETPFLPSRYVSVDAIPRESRWIDRTALRARGGRLVGPVPATPPRTPTESLLVSIASEVTGLPPVGVHDDFFRTVGDAATALRFVLKGRAAGLDVSPALVQLRTIARMAAALDVSAREGSRTPTPEGTGT